MRRAGAVVLVLCAAACSSSRKDDALPSTIPPPELHSTAAVADPRIDQLQTTLTELLDRIDVLNARIAKLETSQAAPQPATVNRQPATVPASPQPSTTPAAIHSAQIADEYRRAIMLVSQNRPVDARAVFQRVFDEDPSGDLADNALFWIGETYYGGGDYHTAMRYYDRVVTEYPDQNKAPDALYKLGMAYVKTGDLAMAERAFNDCITKYPYSSPAATARMELKKIKY